MCEDDDGVGLKVERVIVDVVVIVVILRGRALDGRDGGLRGVRAR